MNAENIKNARKFMLITPVVYSASADRKIAASLRRLGADEATVAKLTRRTAAQTSS